MYFSFYQIFRQKAGFYSAFNNFQVITTNGTTNTIWNNACQRLVASSAVSKPPNISRTRMNGTGPAFLEVGFLVIYPVHIGSR